LCNFAGPLISNICNLGVCFKVRNHIS
jgi:hypothetical protein